MLIHCPPKPVVPTFDRDDHLIEVPLVPLLRRTSSSLNVIEKAPRDIPGGSILLWTERIEIYTVAARDKGGTADIVVVLRSVLVDCTVIVLGEVLAYQPGQLHPSPAPSRIPLINFALAVTACDNVLENLAYVLVSLRGADARHTLHMSAAKTGTLRVFWAINDHHHF